MPQRQQWRKFVPMDGFSEIAVFVRVVDAKSFTRAGKVLGLTASGVSRVISRLESRLGARLLERSTRSVGLTTDGAAYYERCAKILRELEDANVALAQSRSAPRGRLRVDTPTSIAHGVLGPEVPRFLAKYPELSLDLSVRDHLIDPIAEGVDVVIRMAELRESELVQKKMGAIATCVVASPAYLAARGCPRVPSDLRDHDTIGFSTGGVPIPWRLREDGHETTIVPHGRIQTNSSDTLRNAAVAGLGLAQLFEFLVRDEIEEGSLEIVLADHEAPPRTVYALYTREKASSPKVRAFLDFFAEVLAEATAKREVAAKKATRRRGSERRGVEAGAPVSGSAPANGARQRGKTRRHASC
jgi:DNA-binding transcriptional LysR family regulator